MRESADSDDDSIFLSDTLSCVRTPDVKREQIA